MDECLQTLVERKEHPADAFLVQLVKLQLIVEKVAHAPWSESSGDLGGPIKAPSHFYLRALQRQLEDFKQNIPSELLQNGTSIPIGESWNQAH